MTNNRQNEGLIDLIIFLLIQFFFLIPFVYLPTVMWRVIMRLFVGSKVGKFISFCFVTIWGAGAAYIAVMEKYLVTNSFLKNSVFFDFLRFDEAA